MLNEKIFKAYDIRGIYNQDFDQDTAYKLGQAFAELRKEETGKDKLQIVVGGDMRLSTPIMKEYLIKGLVDSGVDVIDIGLASTPTFYFAVAYFNYDGGLIVSASHNPPEWNGFKMTRENGKALSFENGIKQLRDKVTNNAFGEVKSKGTVTTKNDVLEKEVEYALHYSKTEEIKNLKIVVDTANSMGATYIEKLFKDLPCELIKINFELDGSFPAHEPDPFKEENLVELKEKIISEKANLGISTDGDGDRIFFVDEKGQTIDPSIIRAILSKIFLQKKPGSKICYDIRPGKITPDTIIENGGTPIITKVGHSLIKEDAIQQNAFFAGESSGHFFLNLKFGCFEMPNIMILELLKEFSKANMTLSEYIKPYQRYFHSGEINNLVEDKEKILQTIEEKYSDGKINKLDGITVEYKDYWFNVRPSNTEEKLRLNLEAVSQQIMEEKRDEVLAIIRQN